MKNNAEDVAAIVLLVVIIIVGYFGVYGIAHFNGYFHGATIEKLYFEEFGIFPSESELLEWEGRHWATTKPNPDEPYGGRP